MGVGLANEALSEPATPVSGPVFGICPVLASFVLTCVISHQGWGTRHARANTNRHINHGVGLGGRRLAGAQAHAPPVFLDTITVNDFGAGTPTTLTPDTLEGQIGDTFDMINLSLGLLDGYAQNDTGVVTAGGACFNPGVCIIPVGLGPTTFEIVSYGTITVSSGDGSATSLTLSAPSQPTPDPVPPSYQLTYDADGGSCPGTSDPVPFNMTTDLPTAEQCTRTGFTLDGFATSKGGSAVYKPGESVSVLEPRTLWAVWQPVPVVSVDNGGLLISTIVEAILKGSNLANVLGSFVSEDSPTLQTMQVTVDAGSMSAASYAPMTSQVLFGPVVRQTQWANFRCTLSGVNFNQSLPDALASSGGLSTTAVQIDAVNVALVRGVDGHPVFGPQQQSSVLVGSSGHLAIAPSDTLPYIAGTSGNGFVTVMSGGNFNVASGQRLGSVVISGAGIEGAVLSFQGGINPSEGSTIVNPTYRPANFARGDALTRSVRKDASASGGAVFTLLGTVKNDGSTTTVTLPSDMRAGPGGLLLVSVLPSGATQITTLPLNIVPAKGGATARVLFAEGKAALDAKAKKQLKKLAGAVPVGATVQVDAYGLLDKASGAKGKTLAIARAKAVATYLVSLGVATNYGWALAKKTLPDTPESRRVDVVMTYTLT